MRQIRLLTGLFTVMVVFGGFTPPILAYVMQSASYRLQQDSINFYGGQGTSTSYKLEDTGGEIATGYSTSTSYMMHAGYQQAGVTISIKLINDISLTPSIPGVSGGSAAGYADAVVTTDSPSGYTLQIKASTAPAMQSGANSFADYTNSGNPDYDWSINAADSEFGFYPAGDDLVQRYRNNGANACNQPGGGTTGHCWDPLGTVNATISQSAASTIPTGATTTLNFKAESGTSHFQAAGSYSAHITVTAYVN